VGSSRLKNKRSHFAAGVLTPALIKYRKGDVRPPLETPFNGSTLKSAWSTINSNGSKRILGKTKKAGSEFQAANPVFFINRLALRPQSVRPRGFGSRLCQLSVGQFREPAIYFRGALQIHPRRGALRHNLAMAEAEGGGSGYLH